MYSFTVLETRSQKSGVSRVMFPWKALGEDFLSLFLASGGGQQSLACRYITPISATVVLRPSPSVSHLPPSMSKLSSSHKDNWILQYDLILTKFHLQRPYFQARSHSEVPVDMNFGDTLFNPVQLVSIICGKDISKESG